MEQLTDIECVIATLDGQTDYFGVLVERYSGRIRSLVGGIVGSADDADDLTQEIFVRAWSKLSTFRRRSSFPTWLYRIAYNAAISTTRRRGLPQSEIDDRRMESVEDEPDGNRFSDADVASLEKAMAQLRPNERAAVEMFYRDDMSVADVASVLNLSEGNVKVVLHRARHRLAEMIEGDKNNDE